MRFARSHVRERKDSVEGLINIGFVPTIDCVPLIAARELGLFRAHGLDVRLRREIGWAAIREKLIHEELDAALAPASLPLTLYCGLRSVRRPCLTGLLFGHRGSAITVSQFWWERGARDAASMAATLRRETRQRRFLFGIEQEFSIQHFLLSEWLGAAGLHAGRDVEIAVVPPSLMHRSLRGGHLDGYCVAEPWNAVAGLAGAGVVAGRLDQSVRGLPDKAIVVMQDFAECRREEHEHLLAALLEADEYCSRPEHCGELAGMLSEACCLDVEANLLNDALGKCVRTTATADGSPERSRGLAILDRILSLAGESEGRHLRSDAVRRVFREDVFAAAVRRARLSCTPGNPPSSPAAIAGPGGDPPDTTGGDDEVGSRAELHLSRKRHAVSTAVALV